VLARLARSTTGRKAIACGRLDVVAEYEKTIIDELDLMREAANAAQLRRNFAGSDLLYVPEIYWDYCRPEVLVQERIHGVLISNMDERCASAAPISRPWPRTAWRFFSRRCSGTTFSMPTCIPATSSYRPTIRDRKYAAVDFGIVGSLESRDQNYLAEQFHRFFDRDYHQSRVCISIQAGCRPTPASTNSRPPSAPCANRSSTSR
jgi:ubiquinone biosynthesis protein